ncbi:TetR/AcrR family transcriptional regulator [Tsukamurella sp. 8F]|uniref:TetR/AcrR family transcriptional regulator n=1 Tax=unclassified Tsukamurella TaxID=2633480 RepID=UPI0023B8DFC0|nr:MULTISPECIES: TetR/AcrR family transcriptional regulator [unclassified Tsukamurella]MDF0529357.1 TetR/AcrR family transcriptional regulator [Tsukamurella sp. 8J]MDF0587136.1 TetR/AcrR family transcriptional regulator [Tsukamurella sp. 8F]
MARRGDVLREHILDTAKELFLESGFEGTSMDSVAARAQTSKRSLYAHFPTKDALFGAVIDRIGELFQGRMQTPDAYSDVPDEAVALYCARLMQMLSWEPVVQTCRLGVTAAPRFPDAARRLHGIFFADSTARLAEHLARRYGLDDAGADVLAERVIGATVHPHLPRLLFGIERPRTSRPELQTLADDEDLPAIRRAVDPLLATVRR